MTVTVWCHVEYYHNIQTHLPTFPQEDKVKLLAESNVMREIPLKFEYSRRGKWATQWRWIRDCLLISELVTSFDVSELRAQNSVARKSFRNCTPISSANNQYLAIFKKK